MNSSFKKFILLWLGEMISAIGGGLTSFGLGVYIFQKTGSAAAMALVTLIGFLPTLVLSIPAGALADKFDRRILMMLGDGLSAVGVLYILICMLTNKISFTHICIGVFISAVFSSLLEPSYRATISDLLSEEEYSKASGLVSLAGSSRYLVSPLIAGLLVSVCDVSVLLLIDICTFFVTLTSTYVIKKELSGRKVTDNNIIEKNKESFLESIVVGWKTLYSDKGIFILVMITAVLTLFIGIFQILAEPIILSFSNAKTLGIAETICASGMVCSSIYLGIRGLQKNYLKMLSLSLAIAGIFIFLFGIWENIYLLSFFGFGFFMMLPFANTCLDYLIRVNIPDELQGRVWGFIGFLSQIGYVIAYGVSGILADSISKINHISVGRGAAIIVCGAGILLVITSLLSLFVKSLKNLEHPSKI